MLVKAEFLWTRVCPLNCHYCNMVDGRKNTPTVDFWKRGIDNLKKLGCSFVAIYGAEPLSDFDKLPDVVSYLQQNNIHTTVITTGCVSDYKQKIKQLYDAGLRSLTTSYDIVTLDKSSRAKSKKAIQLLDFFRQLGPVDNVAIVVTLTRKNYQNLVQTAKEMSQKNIWTFFDIIHPDRNQPGSKVKGADLDLLFTEQDIPQLINELHKLQVFRNSGGLVHASDSFLNYLITNPNALLSYSWNCAKHIEFPSWVTVDCNGLVYPCDDYNRVDIGTSIIHLFDDWEKTKKRWKDAILSECPGCVWNTHIDAHNIKAGTVNISEYVHKI